MVAESEALATIAMFLGRTADAAVLRARQADLGKLLAEHLWSESNGVFSNVLANGSAYIRIAPTSFYPMLAGVASDAQATRMIYEWLSNQTRFCVPASPAAWPPAHPTRPNGASAEQPQFRGPNPERPHRNTSTWPARRAHASATKRYFPLA